MRYKVLAGLFGLVFLSVAACSSSDSTDDAADDDTSELEELAITIDDLTFSPSELDAQPGQTVRVVNNDDFPHTVTSESAVGAYDESGDFDTETIAVGDEVTFTIPEDATAGSDIYFYCIPHLGSMTPDDGTIHIVDE